MTEFLKIRPNLSCCTNDRCQQFKSKLKVIQIGRNLKKYSTFQSLALQTDPDFFCVNIVITIARRKLESPIAPYRANTWSTLICICVTTRICILMFITALVAHWRFRIHNANTLNTKSYIICQCRTENHQKISQFFIILMPFANHR